MKCPKCNVEEDKVIDSRPWKDGAVVRRRRECLSCNYRFTTYEEIEREDLRAVKRDGRYEPFDRRKLVLGFQKACEKRPVSPELIEKTVDKVMECLKKMDDVAYVRFASVYRQFRDARDFVSEVKNLGAR
jgi:transcriptional repressor NrdR